MVLADGTPMLLTWNANCPVSDPDKVEYSSADWKNFSSNSDTTACIKGIIDINGPKGPNMKLSPSALFYAQKTGLPIVGLTYSIKNAKLITRSWDSMLVPAPFSNGTRVFISDYQIGIQHAVITKGVGAAKFFIQGLHHRFLLQA